MRRHHPWSWNALAVVGLLVPMLTMSAGVARGAVQGATPAASPAVVECPPDAAGAPEGGVVRIGVILPLSGT
ncbi:MAG: hypothetical protein M3P94_01410, partial [Chloroflexota bacterium]|nr:hypothetical protein [Chloroflexota bacterium]